MALNRLSRLMAEGLKPVIGCVHLAPTPSSHRFQGSIPSITKKAVQEALLLNKHGVHALIIENTSDVPYLKGNKVGPELTASMTRISTEIRKAVPNCPIGIQVLAACNKEALAIAQAADLDFVRVEGYVFSHVGDEGFTDSCAAELLRYRHNITADHISIFADIKKKHSAHAITADLNVHTTAKAADFFLVDAVVVTGESTGLETKVEDLHEAKTGTSRPVLIGSGISAENVHRYKAADGFIIGSSWKEQGRWDMDLSEERIIDFMAVYEKHIRL